MNRQDAKTAKRLVEPTARADAVARSVIGAAIEVHKELGRGFLESVYEKSLTIELELKGLQYLRQPTLSIFYKGHEVGGSRLDLLVEEEVVVEIKTVDCISRLHTAQVISYLKAFRLSLGLIINFKVPVLKQGLRRVVTSEENQRLGELGVLAV